MSARNSALQVIQVAFPSDLLARLESVVPMQDRDRYIAEATEEALRRDRLEHALEVSAGAWSDEDHPDLATAEDVDRYVRCLRETWMSRTWDEIAEEAEAEMSESREQKARHG